MGHEIGAQVMKGRFRGDAASQIVEFAVVLPLLIVLLVAIFDFGEVFNTKQKLHSAARETVRFTANITPADLTQGANAPSISAARMVMYSYLQTAKLNTCGLDAVNPSYNNYVWTYIASTGCPAPLVLVIANPVPVQNGEKTLLGSRVTITYPVRWRFNIVVPLIAPEARYPGTVFTLTAEAFMMNI